MEVSSEDTRQLILADAGFVDNLLYSLAELGDGVTHLLFVSPKRDVEADHLPVPVDGHGLGACQILGGMIAKLAHADVLHVMHVVTLWSHSNAEAGRKEGLGLDLEQQSASDWAYTPKPP
jgi:hypothetical protein